jgi:hypothetical protein
MSLLELTAPLRKRFHRPRRSSRRIHRIAELAQTLALLLEDAADAGCRKPHGAIGENGRGKGLTDSDPTGRMALDPRRSQIRRAAKRAALLSSRPN